VDTWTSNLWRLQVSTSNNVPQIFQFDPQQVRTIVKDDEPWFVAKDLAEILG